LQACRYIDEIIVYETEFDLLQLLKTQSIHIRFLSEEYKDRDFTGKQYCLENSIELYYHKRQHIYSSSELRARTARFENIKDAQGAVIIPQYSPELTKISHEPK
jgi:glycerol-3-phosphate cytidylyltransferase